MGGEVYHYCTINSRGISSLTDLLHSLLTKFHYENTQVIASSPPLSIPLTVSQVRPGSHPELPGLTRGLAKVRASPGESQ